MDRVVIKKFLPGIDGVYSSSKHTYPHEAVSAVHKCIYFIEWERVRIFSRQVVAENTLSFLRFKYAESAA